MKKLLFLAVTMVVLFMSTANTLMAQEEEGCPCGEDEMGECLPCDEAE